jgi:hypothetical protein
MKKLNLVALILGILGLCTYLYNLLVLQPVLGQANVGLSNITDFELYSQYRGMSDLLGLSGTSLAGIGFILGLIGYFKSKTTQAILIGLLCGVLAFLNFWTAFARVV